MAAFRPATLARQACKNGITLDFSRRMICSALSCICGEAKKSAAVRRALDMSSTPKKLTRLYGMPYFSSIFLAR